MVYHLKLEEDKHYVGITYNLNQRYAQHISGDGAKWTKLHKPMDVEQVWMEGSEELENQIKEKDSVIKNLEYDKTELYNILEKQRIKIQVPQLH